MSKSLYCTACPPLRPGESETLSAGLLQCYGPGFRVGGQGGGFGWVGARKGGCGVTSSQVTKISDHRKLTMFL